MKTLSRLAALLVANTLWLVPALVLITGEPRAVATTSPSAPQCKPPNGDETVWQKKPNEHFSQGAQNFQKVKETLLKNNFNEKITEDDLYEAATQGMLQNINHEKWDKLLAPSEYGALKDDLKGEVVGIGIGLKFNDETGHANVIDVLPGTPAEKAGLLVGDEILRVNNESYKGKPFSDMVYTIRGKEGETVRLKVLRGDNIFNQDILRERVRWAPTRGTLLSSKIGLINIDYFVGTIPTLVKQALVDLQKQGVKDIILDLRQNQGGLFDSMVETASLFVPNGATVTEAVHRGGHREAVKSKGSPLFKNGRVIVLVNAVTSSSAEILAGALKDDLGARIVGQKTFGKWNGQSVEDLPNGYAFKYTTTIFETPRGEALNGKGLEPDVAVDVEENPLPHYNASKSAQDRLKSDAQLRTAFELLK